MPMRHTTLEHSIDMALLKAIHFTHPDLELDLEGVRESLRALGCDDDRHRSMRERWAELGEEVAHEKDIASILARGHAVQTAATQHSASDQSCDEGERESEPMPPPKLAKPKEMSTSASKNGPEIKVEPVPKLRSSTSIAASQSTANTIPTTLTPHPTPKEPEPKPKWKVRPPPLNLLRSTKEMSLDLGVTPAPPATPPKSKQTTKPPMPSSKLPPPLRKSAPRDKTAKGESSTPRLKLPLPLATTPKKPRTSAPSDPISRTVSPTSKPRSLPLSPPKPPTPESTPRGRSLRKRTAATLKPEPDVEPRKTSRPSRSTKASNPLYDTSWHPVDGKRKLKKRKVETDSA
ncbi:hypothetical protein SAICODRAFT_30203 [Saitoella complicata NRRL Y-17804]|uniref:uncharacterized protein n=1 Tax=Saitoella complicata (strain BCRC 22490 / CBS 7301 / JCM 7358 / NBRC 10748 / NRRL Y-17804) TaxID=698492 RepID=UPI000867AC0D|nr:uncharacterized protein SAICODRAFT_30203 [Saitoella complicata NRRL Y-17804]ODQ53093.1 hypothetical protein SAICODRAFT_30203 [Saitoella complicata NRRL Y-17804]